MLELYRVISHNLETQEVVNLGLGGMFTMSNGKVKQHIMPDFSSTPLTSETQLNSWLRFYDMETPLTAVGTFVSAETVNDPIIKGKIILNINHRHENKYFFISYAAAG